MQTVAQKIASATLYNWRDDIREGDVLKYWHDAGCMGATLGYVRVLKVCPVKLKVRGERGEIGYKSPHWFSGKVNPDTVAELGLKL
jgi:hypothetical protein